MPATIVKGNFQDTLEPIAKKAFHLGLGRQVNSRRDMFYRVEKSDKLTETYLELGDIGTVPEFDGELEYQNMSQGHKMTITAKEYASGLRIERKFVRTDQLRVAKQLPEMLGLAMRRRYAADGCSWFNNMFNTIHTTRDGLALCSTAHTSLNGGSNQANRITTAFSAVALSAARITMRRFMSNTDQVLEITPGLLAGSIDLEDAFDEVIKTQGKVDSANNNINVHKGKYTSVTDVRFSDTNNWALIDKDLMKQYNIWNEVDPTEFKKAEQFDNLVAKYLVYAFYGFGPTGWEWILGAEVD